MKTDQLIRALAADRARAPSVTRGLAGASLLGAASAALAVWWIVGLRPDLDGAFATPRFAFKPLVTLVLALAALGAVARLARPGAPLGGWRHALYAAPALAAIAVVAELLAVPPAEWRARLIGENALFCLTLVPALALVPLGCVLLALRRGAATRPALAGAVGGLLAGGLAAAFYALHCTDDSPLFVATWYTAAVALVAGAGALAGRRLLRW